MTECPLDESRSWKVYGPDLDGHFGSLQGTGGLEATIVQGSGVTKGVINDQFGNGVASVTGGAVSWFTTRVGAYGPLPGTSAETLTDITRVAEATAWRSRRIDPTGLYCLGARYYEPTSGRFISADPAGHASSMSLYDYASGDPVNRMDPDGRLATAFANLALDPFDAAALGDLYADVVALNAFNGLNSAPESGGSSTPATTFPFTGPAGGGCTIGTLQNLYYANNANVPSILTIQTAAAKYLNTRNLFDKSWTPLFPSDIANGQQPVPGLYFGTAASVVKTQLASYGFTATTVFFNKTDPSSLQALVTTYKAVGLTMLAPDKDGTLVPHAVMYDGRNMYTNVPGTADGHASTIAKTPAEMVELVNENIALVLQPLPGRK